MSRAAGHLGHISKEALLHRMAGYKLRWKSLLLAFVIIPALLLWSLSLTFVCSWWWSFMHWTPVSNMVSWILSWAMLCLYVFGWGVFFYIMGSYVFAKVRGLLVRCGKSDFSIEVCIPPSDAAGLPSICGQGALQRDSSHYSPHPPSSPHSVTSSPLLRRLLTQSHRRRYAYGMRYSTPTYV